MAENENTKEEASVEEVAAQEEASAQEEDSGRDKAEGDVIADAETPVEEAETCETPVEDKPIEEEDPLKAMEAKLNTAEEATRLEHDRLLRLSAEFDNFKKRTQREMTDFRKYANESIIKELLTVVDNLERAVDVGATAEDAGAESGMIEGVDLTLKGILKVLEKYKVTPVEAAEKPFDPNFHQAVMQEESDEHPEGTVLKELQKGYLLHDRLIRPAMVVVSKAKTKAEA